MAANQVVKMVGLLKTRQLEQSCCKQPFFKTARALTIELWASEFAINGAVYGLGAGSVCQVFGKTSHLEHKLITL
jgi:hypothetical protein